MTYALDATYSTGDNLSGVGVYSREILHGLARAHPEARFTWCYRPHRLWRAFTGRPPNASLRPLLENVQLFRTRLFHGLNQRLPARRFTRSVCTFHDLFVLTSDYSTAEFRRRFAQQAREAASRADLVICVSTFTAAQVSALLGVDSGRLRVIPHGTRFPTRAGSPRREPLILHVGAIQHRKNLSRLVAAFERCAPSPWRLALAGSDGFGAAEIHRRIAASRASDRIDVLGWVDDNALNALYVRASIFAFPSLDEGFGIPVLEAMAQGVPVLSSNRSALPEACGDAALLVDPLSEDDIAHALTRLIADSALRGRLALAGRARAEQFPWSRAVASTWNVYREMSP
ncbi:MAG: glycosyltransferase family 4 protein [Candidatus Solibacter usitatus]|nr:glycosyltransferase family 4 protein [Candidatus Solibacter usitatus]